MSRTLNTIAGILGTTVLAGGVAMAVPQSRNAIMDSIAKNSTIYQTAMENNSKLEQDNKDLQETSSAQADAIAKLKTDLDTKSTALTKCQGDLETVTGKKTELESALSSKEIVIQNLTQDKTDLTTQLTTANSEKETLQTQLDTANSEKSELESSVAILISFNEALLDQKSTLETELETAETDKQALQTQLDSVNSQLETTQSDLATAQSSLATKTSEVEGLTSQLAEKQSQIDSLTSQLSTKQSELDQANADKANLQSQLDSANAQISTLQGQISTLETEKADLQKQVDDLTASAEVVMTTQVEFSFSFPTSDSSLQICQTAGTENYFDYESWNYFINNYNSNLMVEKYDVAKFSYQEVSAESRKYLCTCRPAYNFTSDYNFYFGSISEENKILDITSYFHNFGSYRDVSFFVENREVEIIDNDIVIRSIGVNVSDANCFVNSERGYLYSSKTAGYLCYNYVKLDENGYTGFYPIYTVNNELVCNGSTVSISDDGRVVTYNGVDFTLEEPDVTANNITAYIGGTVDGVQTTIHIGDGNNYIKFGDDDAISIEIMTIDELKTSGYMSIMRTDTSETIYLSNITLNYNASSGIYVISSATYNGVILAC